jgi:hypothetical protein
MAVVYEHIRKDTNEVFYVGKGETPSRAFSKHNRNRYWKNIVNKTDYTVEIIHSDITQDEACELEKHLIFLYGRKDLGLGSLVNMTDGGDGGINPSIETRKKLSNRIISDKTRQKLSDSHKGENHHMYGKTHSNETKEKISVAHKGKIHSDETKKNMTIIGRNKKGVKGYTYDKNRNKYHVRIGIGGKNIFIGSFNTPSEAEEAYKNARIRYFA